MELPHETNGSYDVSVNVGASPLDTTTILNDTVLHTLSKFRSAALLKYATTASHLNLAATSLGVS